jgi:hypothetical protein
VHSLGPPTDARTALPANGAVRNLRSETPVRGLVRSEGGRPIARASVCAAVAITSCCSPELCQVTDEQGHFSLDRPANSRLLLASAPGYASKGYALPESGRAAEGPEISIVLAEGGGASVTGHVVDATGGMVSGALVVGRGLEEGASATAISDSEGSFRLDVPAGALELTAQAEAYSRMIRRVEAPVRDVTLVLAPESSISGQVVVEGTGAPIASARVTAINLDGVQLPGAETESGADGTYRISGLPAGDYALSARAEGWQELRARVALALGEAATGTLRLSRAAVLRASVSVAGRPCAGASVLLDGPSAASGVTAADGTLSIATLRPGGYRAEVRCANALVQHEQLLLGEAPTTRHFELDAGLTLRGSVERANGQPFPHAPVLAMPVPGDPAPAAASGQEAASSSGCAADATGAFACAGLQPGTYDVRIEGQGQEQSPAVRVALRAGSEPRVVLRAHGSGTIRVSLPDAPDGTTVVLAVPKTKEQGNAVLRAAPRAGRFVFEDVRLGRYRVALASSATAGVDVALERDAQVLDVELSVPPLRSISGNVVDERGVPVPDAWVRATSEDDFTHSREASAAPVLSDSGGAFSISGLFDGKYTLSVSSALGEATLPDVVGGTQAVVVRFQGTGDRAEATELPVP